MRFIFGWTCFTQFKDFVRRHFADGNKNVLVLICSSMPTEHIIAMLRAERDKLDRALQALESGVKRRGRPVGSGRKAAASDYNDPTMPDWTKPKSALKKTASKQG